MNERLPSGNRHLDAILNGGLLKNAINLIVGIPGSGKTILSQQFAFHNADMGQVLGEHGLDDVMESVDRLLKDVNPGVVVIDSFRAFHALAPDASSFRRFLYALTRRLTAASTTSIWNAPYSRTQAVDEAEFAVADGIIALDLKQVAERELRVLQVLKLRGSGFQSGEHVYRITGAGLLVFPRLADAQDQTRYELSAGRSESGIAALGTSFSV